VIVYHGTTKRAAEAIRREGLKPHRASAYKILLPDGKTMEEYDELGLAMAEAEGTEAAYFSPNPRTAMQYAVFRTNYELSEYGQLVTAPGLGEFTKIAPTPKPKRKETPAVVVLDVPDDFAEKNFLTDIGDYDAMMCTCEIGPEHVVKILEAK
jgi:hypothetical protein